MNNINSKLNRLAEKRLIATIVCQHNTLWGAYVITNQMLIERVAPVYVAEYQEIEQVKVAISQQFPNHIEQDFTDTFSFWTLLQNAGIQKPENLPYE